MKELRVPAGRGRKPLGFALYAALQFSGPLLLFLNFFYDSLGLMLAGFAMLLLSVFADWLPESVRRRIRTLFYRPRHLVFDIDFVRLEEGERVLWETGWADIVRYESLNFGGSTLTDRQGKTYRLAGWEWLVPAHELARSDAVFASSKYVGTWPLILILPVTVFIGSFLLYGTLKTSGATLAIIAMTCGVLAAAFYLTKFLRRRKRIIEVIKGEKPVMASSIFFLREIIDPRRRQFEFCAEGKSQILRADKRLPWRPEVEGASIVFEGREMLLQIPGEPPLVIEPGQEGSSRGYVKRKGERLLVPLDLYQEVEPMPPTIASSSE